MSDSSAEGVPAWTSDMPLRADATDEQLCERHGYLYRRCGSRAVALVKVVNEVVASRSLPVATAPAEPVLATYAGTPLTAKDFQEAADGIVRENVTYRDALFVVLGARTVEEARNMAAEALGDPEVSRPSLDREGTRDTEVAQLKDEVARLTECLRLVEEACQGLLDRLDQVDPPSPERLERLAAIGRSVIADYVAGRLAAPGGKDRG